VRQSVVIGQPDRGWRLRTIMGDLPRDLIARVKLGAASDRTRRAILHLNTGESITLRMSRAAADQLRDRLSERLLPPGKRRAAYLLGLGLFFWPGGISPLGCPTDSSCSLFFHAPELHVTQREEDCDGNPDIPVSCAGR
jgi:hypothetical protein